MRRWILIAALLLAPQAAPAQQVATALDVAPTTLDLAPGATGLFFVTNHGPRPVTVQIEAMDWRQELGRDRLTPSDVLMASPPQVRIAPGARQSVRVMARPESGGEHAYRLLVSELPDANAPSGGVRVLLQFSVPVFVRQGPLVSPRLHWSRDGGRLRAANAGSQTVKLNGLTLDGVAPDGQGLVYILPGAAHDFGAMAGGTVKVQVQDGRSDAILSTEIAP